MVPQAAEQASLTATRAIWKRPPGGFVGVAAAAASSLSKASASPPLAHEVTAGHLEEVFRGNGKKRSLRRNKPATVIGRPRKEIGLALAAVPPAASAPA